MLFDPERLNLLAIGKAMHQCMPIWNNWNNLIFCSNVSCVGVAVAYCRIALYIFRIFNPPCSPLSLSSNAGAVKDIGDMDRVRFFMQSPEKMCNFNDIFVFLRYSSGPELWMHKSHASQMLKTSSSSVNFSHKILMECMKYLKE